MKKQRGKQAAALFLTLLLLTSCSARKDENEQPESTKPSESVTPGTDAPEETDPEEDPEETDGPVSEPMKVSLDPLDETLQTEDGTMLMRCSLQVPFVTPEERYTARNAKLRAKAEAILTEAKRQAEDARDWAGNPGFQTITYMGTCDVKRADEAGWLSVLFTTEYNLGGVHPGMEWQSVTFAPGSDEPLTLSRLLGKTEEETSEYIVEAFRGSIEAQPELYFEDALTLLPSLAGKVGFYVTEDGKLTLYLEPYEITPYAVGMTSVTLPLPEGAGA